MMKAARPTWWVWARFEAWLSGLSAWSSPLLFGGFLLWFVGWTVLAGFALDATVDEANQLAMADAAGRLIPAVGVLFAEAPVQFKGMPAFDGRRSVGLLAFLVPDRIDVEGPGYQGAVAGNVPLPPAAAALGAALAGLAGLAALRRRARGPV